MQIELSSSRRETNVNIKGGFKGRVEELVGQIPEGRVMTYGQLAALCGNPRASRVVGGIAHYGDPELPWHRVVNKKGGLASGYHGGRLSQKERLEGEGVRLKGEEGQWYVDVEELLWWPEQPKLADRRMKNGD